MTNDFTIFLWLVKIGALINLYFLAKTFGLPSGTTDSSIVIPAQILFGVSAFRCLFPNRYKDNVVFHATPLSSIFLTRILASFAEVAYIYQFSHVIRLLNLDRVGWVDALSWLMVVQVVISQGFVWGAILTERLVLYVYEEAGWAILFVANTLASAYLYTTLDDPLGGAERLLQINLLFGLVYLPWQMFHLRSLRREAKQAAEAVASGDGARGGSVKTGWHRSIHERNRRCDAASWGGFVGLTWMVSYFATLIPVWVYYVVLVLAAD